MPSTQSLARLCCIYSGLTFGIYWIPLRSMEAAGLSGLWSILLFTLLPAIFVLPLLVVRYRQFFSGSLRFHITIFTVGLGYVLYAGAFLYTEVIRVIVMFYLLPIWGFILARIFIGEKITISRGLSMILGAIGLIVICDINNGFPVPTNSGDWMALCAGFIWASAALMLLTGDNHPLDYTIGFLIWSSIIAAILVTYGIVHGVEVIFPDVLKTTELAWFIPFVLIILIPAGFATIYGPTKLSPGIVGLLFMTEISVATVTAALFAGEAFGSREIIGVILITLAGVAEPVFERIKPTAYV